jgi:HlyD family secretion protein
MPDRSLLKTTLAPMSLALTLLATGGCNPPDKSAATNGAAKDAKTFAVTFAKPQRELIRRIVAQPGQIKAFEQTPIYPKIAGYVLKWNVDIGDQVDEGKVLAELYVPEMVQELKQKEAAVQQGQKALEVAKGRAATAAAYVEEVKAGLQRAEANRERWQIEYARMSKLAGSVIDVQSKDEAWNQYQSAKAGEDEVKAKVSTARATWEEAKAMQEKALADIAVAEADRERVSALLDYAKLMAPFKGVVTRRNINTGDFVQPPTAGKGEPLFVVERQDVVRVFVAVPEAEAAWVRKGSKATIKVQALQGQQFDGDVVRTANSLDPSTRTLLVEIDLPNKQDLLRPGLYAYATISAQHEGLTVPASAVVTQGDATSGYQSWCFLEKDGKLSRVVVELGVRQGPRVQVLRKQVKAASPGEPAVWQDFSGEENVVQQNVGSLTDGMAVGGGRQ